MRLGGIDRVGAWPPSGGWHLPCWRRGAEGLAEGAALRASPAQRTACPPALRHAKRGYLFSFGEASEVCVGVVLSFPEPGVAVSRTLLGCSEGCVRAQPTHQVALVTVVGVGCRHRHAQQRVNNAPHTTVPTKEDVLAASAAPAAAAGRSCAKVGTRRAPATIAAGRASPRAGPAGKVVMRPDLHDC